MDFINSSLWREVAPVLASGEKPVHYAWQATVFAGDDAIKPFRVLSIDFNQDYLNNYTDYILLTVLIPLGTYAKRVYPLLGNLDVELKRLQIGEVSSAYNQNSQPEVERYTATMIDTGNPILEASTRNARSEEDLNRLEILTVKFQLTNKSLEQIRMIPVGGIYRNMTGEDVVKAVLTRGSRLTDVDEERKVKGVHMVTASNQRAREVIEIPHNTPLVNVPHHVHYYGGGLYSAGLGYYLHRNHWYVFPAYDHTRFESGDPTLTIINVPQHKLPGVERTYRKDGENLVVIATGPSSFRDIKNVAQLNQGNGVRFADADQLIEGFTTVKGNKAVAARGKSNTEMISEKRENNMNYVTTGSRNITANPYVEYSALAARQGSAANFVWENADRTHLYPGMPTRVLYLDGNEVKEMDGVLLGAHEYTSLREPGGTSHRFSSSVTLSVFVRAQDKQ